MARPKMKFTPEEARTLVATFYFKLSESKFCDSYLDRGPDRSTRDFEAKQALAPLWELYDKSASWRDMPEPFPEAGCEMLRQWIETYVTPQGWQRMQAAKRQRSASRKRHQGSYDDRETSVAMQAHPSYVLGTLSEALGIDKKELLSRLPGWFLYDDKGRAAFKAFSATVHADQVTQGLKLLVEVFQLPVNEVKKALFEAAGFIPTIERELIRFAFLAGKARLTKLTKVLKALPAQEQLKKLGASAQGSKPLLELAGTGCMAEALATLGASEQEDPLVEGVAAVEQSLQDDEIAAPTRKLEAEVPETADFGQSKNFPVDK